MHKDQVCAAQKKLGREGEIWGMGSSTILQVQFSNRFGYWTRIFNLSSQFPICEWELLENTQLLHLSLMTALVKCYQRRLYYQIRLLICVLQFESIFHLQSMVKPLIHTVSSNKILRMLSFYWYKEIAFSGKYSLQPY